MFEVRWEKAAENELAAIWVKGDTSHRKSITASAQEIDYQLQMDPFDTGESRPEGRRIHFLFPLGLLFRVEQNEETVSVLHVWQFYRKTKPTQ